MNMQKGELSYRDGLRSDLSSNQEEALCTRTTYWAGGRWSVEDV